MYKCISGLIASVVLFASIGLGVPPHKRLVLQPDTFKPSQLSGLVLWLDGANATSLTVAADGTISTWADKSGNGYDFVQGTAANKPFLTRSDSLENRLKQSEAIDAASSWTASNATRTDATTLTEDATAGITHYLNQTFETVKGAAYVVTVSLKRGTGTRNGTLYIADGTGTWRAILNLGTGAIEALTGTAWTVDPVVTADGDYYRVSGTLTAAASNASSNFRVNMTDGSFSATYDGDGSSTLNITKAVVRRSSTSSTYLATTTYPMYAGLNGRAVPYFPNDVTFMSRAYAAGLDIATGSFTFLAIAQTDVGDDADSTLYYLRNGTSPTRGFRWFAADATTLLADYISTWDGVGDQMISPTTTTQSNKLLLHGFIQNATTGQFYLNGMPYGATDTLNVAVSASADTFYLGGFTTSSLHGYLPEVLIFNRALSNDELSRVHTYLRRKWSM